MGSVSRQPPRSPFVLDLFASPWQAIAMSAALRLPARVMAAERKVKVDRVVAQLLLGPFEGQQIGVPGASGITPELRKLVTIGVELVCDPKVLFMDEPTTGLDSASALATMRLVRRVCSGRAVICTIHQPAREIFGLFDDLLLLQKGGRVAYFGPVPEMEPHFERVGMPPRELATNPADYALACALREQWVREQPEEWSAADAYEQNDLSQRRLASAPSRRGVPAAKPMFTEPFARCVSGACAVRLARRFTPPRAEE